MALRDLRRDAAPEDKPHVEIVRAAGRKRRELGGEQPGDQLHVAAPRHDTFEKNVAVGDEDAPTGEFDGVLR